MNTYYLSALDEQFKYDCKVINLSYEYPGYTGEEKWAIITDLTEEELSKKYEEISVQALAATLYSPARYGWTNW